MREARLGIAAACLAVLGLGAAAHAEEGFTEMFNGRDLAGWKNVNCAPETWSIREGVVHCTGKPIGALRTERQYENFILELEWRHLKKGGNAGVFIWASPIPAPGVPFLRAIEVQVLDNAYGKADWFTTHGDVFPIHGSTMKPFGRHHGMRSFPSEERSKGSPEWNHYRVECDRGALRLHVNGKQVSGGEQCDWRKGYLGLESEGSPVEFRNVRIKELAPSNTPEAQIAPADPGWQPRYNGVDLRGWRSAGPGENRWAAKDWQLVNPGGHGAGQTLWTENELGDFELVVDVRTPPEAAKQGPVSGLRLRGAETPAATIPISAVKPDAAFALWEGAALAADKWQRLIITARGRDVTIRLGGEVVSKGKLPEDTPSKGPLGLADHGRPVAVANLFVREL